MTTYNLSIDAQICDHMVMELNQSGFIETLRAKAETDLASMSGPYGTATRTYLPEYDHDYPQDYRISVYTERFTQVRLARARFQETFFIATVLFKRLDVGEQRSRVQIEGDKILLLADQLRKWFEKIGPDGAEIQNGDDRCWCARWLGVARESFWELAEMNEYHTMFVPMTHRWTTIRGLAYCGQV